MDDLLDRIVELTRNLVVIPSTASRPDERRQCTDQIRNHLERLPGIRIREYDVDGTQSLVAAPAHTPHPEVLMLGHLDVVDHADEAVFRSRVEDGRIYGPGTGDMKGALAIMMEVFRVLHTRHPGLPLGLAVTADEETGGDCGVRYLFDEAGLRCGVALIPDGGAVNRITVEEKGLLHLTVHAAGHSAHAARPWLGVNALHRLTDRLAAVRAAFDGFAVAGHHWHPTCAATTIQTTNRTVNCIPEQAAATLDVRYPPPYTEADMVDLVRRTLGPDVTAEVRVGCPPTRLEPDPLYLEVTAELTGKPVESERSDGSSDAHYISAFGIPVVLSRPEVGNLHAPEEWIDIASMAVFARIYATYITRRLGRTP